MKKFLNSFEDGVCAIILFVMLILTFVNVIARKFLVMIDPSLGSMPFIEELTCVGLMILSILGAATATKRGAHLGLSVFTDLLPKTAQSVLALICDLLSAAFCAAIIYLGYQYVQNQFTNNVLGMGMSGRPSNRMTARLEMPSAKAMGIFMNSRRKNMPKSIMAAIRHSPPFRCEETW